MRSQAVKWMTILLIASSTVFTHIEVSKAEDNNLSKIKFINEIKNFGKKLTNKVPKIYTKEQALKNGDIVSGTKRPKKQKEKIEEFIHNVKIGKPDFIRFVQFTSLGDAVIKEYQFNGKLIFYRFDSTRDRTHRFSRTKDGRLIEIQKDYCTNLKVGKDISYITNCFYNKQHEF